MAILGDKTRKIGVVEQFAQDVRSGLSSNPKRLSSKYFYDEIGDQIFVKIMNMPEYYLTNCEYEIFSEQSDGIIKSFDLKDTHFDLIELGAGNGTKTIEILKALRNYQFTYEPIDISPDAIINLEARIKSELPWVDVKGMQGEYFEVLDTMKRDRKKIILFLGSNIGNLTDQQSHTFIGHLSKVMNRGDIVVLGVDRKKSKEIVLPAYNDAQGYSREFNLNLLSRINRELGGNFNLQQFTHVPEYDEKKGMALSFLESSTKQSVSIDYLEETFHFNEGERIHTEISRKYDEEIIEQIIEDSGLEIKSIFTDRRKYFHDYILVKQ